MPSAVVVPTEKSCVAVQPFASVTVTVVVRQEVVQVFGCSAVAPEIRISRVPAVDGESRSSRCRFPVASLTVAEIETACGSFTDTEPMVVQPFASITL